jgi:hypothetical protein
MYTQQGVSKACRGAKWKIKKNICNNGTASSHLLPNKTKTICLLNKIRKRVNGSNTEIMSESVFEKTKYVP